MKESEPNIDKERNELKDSASFHNQQPSYSHKCKLDEAKVNLDLKRNLAKIYLGQNDRSTTAVRSKATFSGMVMCQGNYQI